MTDQLSEQSAGAANYRRGIVSAAKALWLGAMDYYQAFDALDTAIRQGIPRAWYEGAKICGIAPNELSPEERTAMQSALFNQTSYINGFLMFVEDNSKASGGKWSTVAARTNTWVNRYNDIVNQAKVSACADQKLEWVFNALGVTKNPCNTCQNKLNGKVKRASYWERVGVRPQNAPNPMLDCSGWNCLCDLVPTDKPLSRGPLPRLP